MSRKLNLLNKKFGRLLVIEEDGKTKKGQYIWKCKCDCGNYVSVVGAKLKNGHTRSCGCLVKDSHYYKHNKTNTRIYKIWCAMKNRCYNKNTVSYKDYGERGIIICDEWLSDFMNFYNWTIVNGYRDDLTIDRIDVNGNYEPSNCRWATKQEQANNTRKVKYYKYNNENHTLKEWSKILEINYNTLRSRILEMNWTLDKAFKKGV